MWQENLVKKLTIDFPSILLFLKIIQKRLLHLMQSQKDNSAQPKNLERFRALLFFAGLFLLGGSFCYFQLSLQPFTTTATLGIRTCSLLAISLLHFVILLQPLSKIHTAFLALLPLRKTAEILLLLFASLHGFYSLFHFHSGGNRSALTSLFLSNTQYGSIAEFPFQILGFIGLLLLLCSAGINLYVSVSKKRVWVEKQLHHSIKLVYGLILLHVVLGVLQYDSHPFYWTGLTVGLLLVLSCFLVAQLISQPMTSKTSTSKWMIQAGLFIVFMGLPFLSYGIVYWQKPFSSHVYEKKNERTFEGFYFDYPEPLIQLDFGYYDPALDPEALLVGPQKKGAQEIIKKAMKKWGILNGKKIRIKGKLLYGDRKQLIELSDTEMAIEVILNSNYPVTQTRSKRKVLQGEIISPKSWFGYMNPAEGKVHKSTAIRSIESGIPPVLRIQKDGRNNYYILQDKTDENFVQYLSPYIAQEVEIAGETFYQNGWNVLTFKKENIRLLN